MAEARSPEALVEVANRTYDALPRIASLFLTHAERAGLSFDPAEMQHHCKLTFDSSTIVFRWCEPSHTSHGVSFISGDRNFNLWFEVRGWASLTHGDVQIYSQRLLRKQGYGDDEFKGDAGAFIDTCGFVSELSPEAFGRPVKVEKW
jgi:hypothetical protein